MSNIYKQLFEAKKEIGKISKESENPFFKSKYFDINKLLECVEPVLQKHDLLILQPVKEGKVFTEIIHVKDGVIISSSIDLPNIQDPQKLGSAITYYRRYTLQSLLGLQAEDDDGNLLVKKPLVKKKEIKKTLTDSQFETMVASRNKEHISISLNKYNMTEAQRKVLTTIKDTKDGNTKT